MSQKPRFVQNALLPLEKMSLGERSGWRNRSAKRVAELRTIFADGQFGQSVACGVQVLPVTDADGASLIDDGVSTVQALVELKAAHAEGKPITDEQLLAIFTQGLHVVVVAYPDSDDMVVRRAWNTGSRGRPFERRPQALPGHLGRRPGRRCHRHRAVQQRPQPLRPGPRLASQRHSLAPRWRAFSGHSGLVGPGRPG